MKSSDFDKLDDFYRKKKEQENAPALEERLEDNIPTQLDKFEYNQTKSNIFKQHQQDHIRGYKYQTITKWDTFEPRAFHKLSNKHKDEHFLKLFEDFIELKSKLNSENQRNKQLLSQKIHKEKEVAELKRNSPERPIPRGRKQQENQNQQLKQQVKRLHQKIIALTGNNQKFFGTRPQSAATKKQKVIVPATQDIKAELQLERRQVKQLLLIIDQLKSAKYSLENQLKQKQSEQPVRTNKSYAPVLNNKNQSQFQEYTFELQRWKVKYNDMQVCFNKMSDQKDRRIKQLEIQNLDLKESQRSKNLNFNFSKVNQMNNQFFQEKVLSLQRENQRLQTEVRRLVQLPFNQNKDNRSQVDLQNKNGQLQLAIQKMKSQLSKAKDDGSKYLADLQFKNREVSLLKNDNEKLKKQVKELIQKQTNPRSLSSQIDYDDYYRKLLGIVRLEGDDPAWRKFAQLASPTFQTMNESQLKTQCQQLWKSKLELLAHLQKAQVQLKTLQQTIEMRVGLYLKDKESLEEQLRQAKARLDEWSSMERVNAKRESQIYAWGGIQYDDSISVFEAEESQIKELENQYNFFDLYLGQLNLDELSLTKNQNNKIKDISKMISFLTVDFYNHDTQHSHFAEGNARKLDNNFSFRVQMNQSLVKYLTKQTLVIELWSPQGSTTVMLGKGQIWLRDLVNNSSKDVSAVIRGKCPFYQSDRSLVATVQYRIRMRLPIGSICQFTRDDSKGGSKISQDLFRLGQRKQLQILITKAFGLPISSSAFVYFAFQGEDYFTEAIRGSSPEWNFKKQIEVMMNEQLQEELKQNYFQFTIFDDDKPVNDDIIGISKADLTRMIDSVQKIEVQLQIKNEEHQIVGKLCVQFRWA